MDCEPPCLNSVLQSVIYIIAAMQVYQPGKGLGFHFDKDVAVMRSSGQTLSHDC
jgi:hypothetical protein